MHPLLLPDVRSIIAVSSLLGLLMTVVLFALWRSYPASVRGLRAWALAPMLCWAASVLFVLRGIIPDAISILAANLALTLGILCFYFGSRQMLGLPVRPERWIPALAALLAALAWYTYQNNDFEIRTIAATGVLAFILFRHAWLLQRGGPPSLGTRLMLITLVGEGLVMLTRMGFAFQGGPGVMPHSSTVQMVYVATHSACLLLLSIASVLMATEDLRRVVEQLASHDALTGALSRGALLDACAEELERSRRHGHSMALLMLDLDHFKAVNDTYGHQTGDRVLADFARRVRAALRTQDKFGRYGGEEFVVMLPEAGLHAALATAERLREDIAAASDTGLPRYTTSIGVTDRLGPEDSVDAMLARADRALYQAKRNGRDRVESS